MLTDLNCTDKRLEKIIDLYRQLALSVQEVMQINYLSLSCKCLYTLLYKINRYALKALITVRSIN